MPTHTLVLSPRYTSDSRVLRNAALQAGWHVERLGGWHILDRLYGRDVVLYGEPSFIEVIAASLHLSLLDAPFDWLLHLPPRYRKRSIELSTLGAARVISQPTFVKPADGRKGFEGKVYVSGAHLPSSDILPDTTPVLMAEPVRWEVEFRCFLLEREVMTISPYILQGKLALTETGTWEASPTEYKQAQAFLETMLADQTVPLPPAIVIDVGKIQKRGWAVLEANAAWGAGLYGCDPASVLSVLARACLRREQLTEDDARWAI